VSTVADVRPDPSADPTWVHGLSIDGRQESGLGPVVAVHDPANEQTIVEIASATTQQVDDAVRSAASAFAATSWATDAAARATALHQLADLIEARRDAFVHTIVREVGTPITLARTLQVGMAVSALRAYADLAVRDRTENLPVEHGALPNGGLVAYRPVGVVAALTAYNYPLYLAAQKVGAALAAGCTVVLAPSPQTPLSTMMLGELAQRVLPAGVLNVIVGGADICEALTRHVLIDKISFTGSLLVGEKIIEQASRGARAVVLELGGKSPNILLPGTDIAAVTPAVHARYLRNAGQGCASPTRILVERGRYEEFVDASRTFFSQVVVGDPFDDQTLVGPVISAAHRDRIAGHVTAALAQGGDVVAGGKPIPYERGWWSPPTVIGGLDNSAPICQEELFGPVSVVLPYDDVDHAVTIANDTIYGLSANVYGPSQPECLKVAERIRAGYVTINGGGGVRADAPFGGMRASGIGRESGEWGVREYLEPQQIQWSLA
jgi:aldehyde dehydrogenase (NAD+)/betaine-aldehyde dehydrogenase